MNRVVYNGCQSEVQYTCDAKVRHLEKQMIVYINWRNPQPAAEWLAFTEAVVVTFGSL